MKTRSTQIFRGTLGLTFVLLLAWGISCSSNDEAPGGGRIAHPVSTPPPLASAAPVPSPSASSSSPTNEPPAESYMTPLDKAIREDHPSRPWSKNVPQRQCTKDEECGDGFCDRGRCAAIWTWSSSYGQRCKEARHCSIVYLCIDGRCRSCVSDAECVDDPDNQDPKCIQDHAVRGSRACVGVAGGGDGDVVPSFPLNPPRK